MIQHDMPTSPLTRATVVCEANSVCSPHFTRGWSHVRLSLPLDPATMAWFCAKDPRLHEILRVGCTIAL